MYIFRIKITCSVGAHFVRSGYTGLFASSQEAIDQTMADWPWARSVAVICITPAPCSCAARGQA